MSRTEQINEKVIDLRVSSSKLQHLPTRRLNPFERLLVFVIFLVFLSGRYSLDRLGFSYGLLGDVRILLGVPATIFVASCVLLRNTKARPMSAATRRLLSLVGLFHLYMVASCLWAPDPRQAFAEGGFLLLLVVLLVVLCRLVTEIGPGFFDTWMVLWWSSAWVYSIAGFLGLGSIEGSTRMSAFGGGANVFVRVMIVGIVSALYLWTLDRNWRYLVPIPAFLAAALASGSRGGILAAGAALLLFTGRFLPRWKEWTRMLVLVSCLVIAAAVVLPSVRQTVYSSIESRFIELTVRDRDTSSRSEIFQAAYTSFRRSPLRGEGMTGFYQTVGRIYDWDYPHNLFLSTAAEGGVLGLILLSLALVSMRSRRVKVSDQVLVSSFIATYFLMASMFSGTYYDARYIWVFALIAVQLSSPTLDRSPTKP